MDITIYPSKLNGSVCAIPSKSQAHRILICAAFSDIPTSIYCPIAGDDIETTAGCLRALGATITRTQQGYHVIPVSAFPSSAVLNCGESGSTLRFLLPVVGALGINATFLLSGRLPQRPLSPLWEQMEKMGCILSHPTGTTIYCSGQLRCGQYSIDDNVSSQFVTGLLLALSILPGKSSLSITQKLESMPYVHITQQVLHAFGVETDRYQVCGGLPFRSPGEIHVEGDWSNSAFFLTAAALGSDVAVTNLRSDSIQGDRAITSLLAELKKHRTVCASDIPDLIPILSVFAAANQGAVFTHIQRLRSKESDRVDAILDMLHSLGIQATATESALTILPGVIHGGNVNSFHDHRIAMSAAIAATCATGPVTVLNADCVAKSYPSFWDDYTKLGGNYEQHLR